MKRSAVIIIIAVLAAAIFAGCGGTPTLPTHRADEIPVTNPNNKPDALEDYTAKDLYELGYLYPDTLSAVDEKTTSERHFYTADGDCVRELILTHGALTEEENASAALLSAGFAESEITEVKEITGTAWLCAVHKDGDVETRGLVTALGGEYYLVKFSFPVDGETAKAQASGIEYGPYMRLIYE